jgi:hypothetical protein
MMAYDVDERVVGTWDYLIRVRSSELRSLPAEVDRLDDHPRLTQEQRWLIGWWLFRGSTYPRRRMSAWKTRHPNGGKFWCGTVRDRLAKRVNLIRHWRVEQCSYDRVPDHRATWFVEPNDRTRHRTNGEPCPTGLRN